jgi:hypothetical protein
MGPQKVDDASSGLASIISILSGSRDIFFLTSGQNSAITFLTKSNPSRVEPLTNPWRTVLRRSGYH